MFPSAVSSSPTIDEVTQKRRAIAFLDLAHGIDHFVLLIYPTVVIGLDAVFERSYSDLIAIATPAFIVFGVASFPMGWLADHWSRRNMMAVFYFGCGLSLALAAAAPNLIVLAGALMLLGVFAAIYHPVGIPMLVAAAATARRGRTIAANGVCGGLGYALAASVTAALVWSLGWRAAFLVPAMICVAFGVAFVCLVRDERDLSPTRSATADVPLSRRAAAVMFGLFVVIALADGLVFNIVTVSAPKILDERLGTDMPLVLVGGATTAVFLCGAATQLILGRLVERVPAYILLPAIALVMVIGVGGAISATGPALMVALALAMTAISGQATVAEVVLARYTADVWRGRIYSVRYFLTFVSSGVAVSALAFLYSRGGFTLVMGVTVLFAFAFLAAAVMIAMLAIGVERNHAGDR